LAVFLAAGIISTRKKDPRSEHDLVLNLDSQSKHIPIPRGCQTVRPIM